MYISPRQKQLLLILLNNEEVLSISSLAQQIQVSKRTVQREMDGIGEELSLRGLKLKSKTGKGVWVEGPLEAKYSLLEKLNQELGLPVIDKEQRMLAIAGELLKSSEPRKLYYFANLFRISESTVAKDMDQTARWLTSYHLNLVRRQGVGAYIEGSEPDRRQALKAYIQLASEHKASCGIELLPRRTFSYEDLDTENTKYSICTLLDQEIVKKVIVCLGSIQHPLIDRMTDYSYTGMIIHITIAISRIRQKEPVKELPEILDQLRAESAYLLAQRIVESLEKEFSMEIPDMECAYICMHLKGAKMQSVDKVNLEEKEDGFFIAYEKTLQLIYQMIDRYDKTISFALKRDEEFMEAMMNHMRPTLARLQYHMEITNPLQDQVKESYSEIYEQCEKASEIIEEQYGFPVPDAEIGFLTMHFATAVMRLSQKKKNLRMVHIGVVCASGMGISRLISTRMKQIFSDSVSVTTYSYTKLQDEIPPNLDFIITTFPLERVSIDSLLIDPLLPEENLAAISQKVEYYASLPKKEFQKDEEEFTKKLDQISNISNSILHLLTDFAVYRVQKGIEFESLVGKAGRLAGQTEADQIAIYQAIMKREQLATQVMEDFDLALLHAKTSGVRSPVFHIYLPESSSFTHPYWKGIHCAVVMLIPDDSHHLDNSSILGAISSKLAEGDTFISLIRAGQEDQIKAFLEKILKTFFKQFLSRFTC